MRRRLRRRHRRPAFEPDPPPRADRAGQSPPPRRLRLRAEHGRRRGRALPDAPRLPRAPRARSRESTCPRPARTASGMVFLPPDPEQRRACEARARRNHPRDGTGRARLAHRADQRRARWARPRGRRSRSCGRSSSGAATAIAGRHGVRAQAVRHPAGGRARDPATRGCRAASTSTSPASRTRRSSTRAC